MRERRGFGKGKEGIGGPEKCVCPVCGYEEVHVRGVRCSMKSCPKCRSRMIGKW